MNKNLITMLIIFVLPLFAYFLLTNSQEGLTNDIQKNPNLPKIIKFSSSMCSDCQKLENSIKDISSNYKNKIEFININVQNRDKKTQELIKKYKVTLVPTLIYLDKDDNVVLQTAGNREKQVLTTDIERLIK